MLRIVAHRLPELPGRLPPAPEGEKNDPEIEVGARVPRLPPDDFAERGRRALVPSGLEERDAEVVPRLRVRGPDAQRFPERRRRRAVPV